MLSLDNVFDLTELEAFNQRILTRLKTDKSIEYTVEPKFDGVAISLMYEKGELIPPEKPSQEIQTFLDGDPEAQYTEKRITQ